MTKFYGINKNNKKITELAIHRQSFSGTDTCQESGKLGIVYPFDIDETINNFVTASSIIDHHNDDSHLLKHTEVRVANKEGESLEYQKIEHTIGVVLHNKQQSSEAMNTYFGMDKFQNDSYCEVGDDINEFTPNEELEESYRDSSTEVIVSDKNLTKKSYGYDGFMISKVPTKKYKRTIENETNLKKKIDKILKPLKIETPIDLDDFYNYLFDYESLYPYERAQYNGFLEYMLFDIEGEIKESIEAFRARNKYTALDLFEISKKIKELIEDNYDVERRLF